MIAVIAALLAIAISFCWYYPGVKAQGNNRVLRKKDYLTIASKYGFAFSCLLIIITEIAWDSIVDKTALSGLPKALISNFFRAALLEEFFKYWGFRLAKNKYALNRKIDYMLTAGLIGLVYGVVEKAVFGNIVAVVLGLAIPMHIMWQFNQGGHYFEYEKQKYAGNRNLARKEWIMAILVPFLFHGCWDSGLDIASYCIEREATTVQVIGGVLFFALILLGVMYSVKTIRKVRRIAREAPETAAVVRDPIPDEGTRNQAQ